MIVADDLSTATSALAGATIPSGAILYAPSVSGNPMVGAESMIFWVKGSVLRRRIPVTVKEIDESFVALFADANVSASGDTPLESIKNLIAMMEDLFQFLEENQNDLGPEPQRQFEVLKKHLLIDRLHHANQGTR